MEKKYLDSKVASKMIKDPVATCAFLVLSNGERLPYSELYKNTKDLLYERKIQYAGYNRFDLALEHLRSLKILDYDSGLYMLKIGKGEILLDKVQNLYNVISRKFSRLNTWIQVHRKKKKYFPNSQPT